MRDVDSLGPEFAGKRLRETTQRELAGRERRKLSAATDASGGA